eukprot:126466_1
MSTSRRSRTRNKAGPAKKMKHSTQSPTKPEKRMDLKGSHYVPQRPQKIAQNMSRLNEASFYTKPASSTLTGIKVDDLFQGCVWEQVVYQSNTSYEESLRITFQGMKPTLKDQKEAHNQNDFPKTFAKAQQSFARVMCDLLQPYVDITSIVDVILAYNGPHILPIRYSVDLLPYFYPTIRDKRARKVLWVTAKKDTTTGDCTVDFEPQANLIVVEDIYDEWVSHVEKQLSLSKQYQEEAIFYIPSGGCFMRVASGNNGSTIGVKDGFTDLYLKALSGFEDSTEYAFRMDLGGINYRYYTRKRSYSPGIYGSRSRCWDGDGMVLLGDGRKKQVRQLAVGDEVAVLDRLPNGVSNGRRTARVCVKIESVVNRKYEMVLVNEKVWITPYHAVLNSSADEWQMPCALSEIKERYVASIFNFILDGGHVLCVNDVWACTLGHDLPGQVIENPMWGSSQVMHDMWSKRRGYPNVVEYV